jgi:hypothetical protein
MFWYAGFYAALIVCISSSFCSGGEIIKYDFAIDDSLRNQYYPFVDYKPIENEFMATWRSSGRLRDDCDPDDYSIVSPDPTDPWSETPGDVRGTIYGEPLQQNIEVKKNDWFLSGLCVIFDQHPRRAGSSTGTRYHEA